MDIVVKSRHTEVSERFKEHVVEKLSKLTRLDGKVIALDVEVSKEHNPRLASKRDRIEITCRSRGPVIRAEASADDLAYAKLEMRLRKVVDRRPVHRGRHAPMSVGKSTAALTSSNGAAARPAGNARADAQRDDAGSDDADFGNVDYHGAGRTGSRDSGQPASGGADGPTSPTVPPLIQVDGEGPLVVREKVHQASPMTLDQALYEMELVGHDFYLFVDAESKLASVVYRRRGYDYGVIRLEV